MVGAHEGIDSLPVGNITPGLVRTQFLGVKTLLGSRGMRHNVIVLPNHRVAGANL